MRGNLSGEESCTWSRFNSFGCWIERAKCLQEASLIGPVNPPYNVLIDLLLMADGENSDLCRHHLEDDAVLPDAKFPVALESLAKGGSKLLGSLCET